ncbi:MAG: hypothetical protein LUG50_06910 [Planctomycetaceae bacterium]|nr:hypothetical protein [Planctomycetaceae bacterium]
MNKYIVEITADIPYPWPRSYREEATNEGAAISRALRQYRADVRNRTGRGKQIKSASVKFRNCGRVVQEAEEAMTAGEEVANV